MKEETLGKVLQRYRLAEKIKIEKVEKDTNISHKVIVALENDDYGSLPEDLYAKHLIKVYAGYLSLDYNKLLNLYEKGKNGVAPVENKTQEKRVREYMNPQMVRIGVIVLVVLALLAYFVLAIGKIYQPPYLEVTNPGADIKTTESFIEIKGVTEKEARVFINEKEIFLKPDGEFSATLDLQKGLNYIKISAIKKHSRERVIFREVLVTDNIQ